MQPRVAIGIDLGGTNLKVGLVDSKGRILAARNCPTQGEKGPDHFIASAAELVDRLLNDTTQERSAVVGAGVGSPGPLDLKRGVLLKTANLSWTNVPLRDLLTSRLQVSVVVDNDANAAAFGEYWCGGSAGPRNLVLLTLGTGVGAGVVLDGQVLHGHFDNAGELGHMIVAPRGLLCGCGQHGCLEAYASASAVARRHRLAVEAGEASSLGIAQESNSKAVADAAREGDKLCQRLWDEACFYLALACINLQHAYNPEMILLGGGMAEARSFLLDRVRAHFDANKWKLHNDFPRIELARLGSDAGLIGAAALAWHNLNQPCPSQV